MQLSDAELEALLETGESASCEFKESLAGHSIERICEAICAFSNDLAGTGRVGVIFIGLKDNGEASDFIPDDRALLNLSNIKYDGKILPLPSMLVEKRNIRGKALAIITVSPSTSPPVRCGGKIVIRMGPRRGIASAQDEQILNDKRRWKNIPFDIQPVDGLRLETLSLRAFEEEYLPRAFDALVIAENGRTIEQRLAATKMISNANDPFVTVLGCLVLGKFTRDIIPGAYIQFLRIDGSQLSDPIIDAADIDGALSDILRRIDEKIIAQIAVKIDFTSSETEVQAPNYPIAAIQQIIRNAVMHRTYEATNAPIRMTWYSDRIEILNPGGPFGQVSIENFGRAGVTDYRNPNLAEAMKVLGYVQRFGVGIATARRLLLEGGHGALVFEVNQSFVLATIWRNPQ